MKSILMGSPIVHEVYSEETKQFLKAHAQLEPVLVTKEEILEHPETYRDTEFIFRP